MIPLIALPHSDDGERAVLGAVILDNGQARGVFALLAAGDFYGERNRRIFTAIRALHEAGTAIDLVTLRDALERSNDLDRAGGVAYLATLVDGTARSTNVEHYARLVRRKAWRRSLVEGAEQVARAAANGQTDVELAALVDALRAERLDETGGSVDLGGVEASMPEYSIVDFVRRVGVHLLYGREGSGKTYCTLSLLTELLAATEGRTLWGHPELALGRPWRRALLVSGEETAPVLRGRWDRVLAGLGLSPSDLVGTLRHRWAYDGATLDRIEALADDEGDDLDAIVFDSWTALLPASFEGRSPEWDRDGPAVCRLLGRLRDCAVRRSLAVVLLHHPAKDESAGPRGSSEIRNAADAIVRFESIGESSVGVEVEKMRDGRKLPPFALRLTFEPGSFLARYDPQGEANASRSDRSRSRGAGRRSEGILVARARVAIVDLVRGEGRIARKSAVERVCADLDIRERLVLAALAEERRDGTIRAVPSTGGPTNALDLIPWDSEVAS